jgi:hypothetical protein
MEREFLQLSIWDRLNEREAEQIAQALARCLPAPFAFDHVELHRLGRQQHHVAVFYWGDLRFSLIPGEHAWLGYDAEHPFIPDEQQWKSWDLATNTFGIDLAEVLRQRLTPLRQVDLQPFLLQTHSERLPQASHSEALTWCGRDGFRLPTSDEWEHACAAGSRTLFRWGNSNPESVWDRVKANAFGLRIATDSNEMEYCLDLGVMRGGDGGGRACGGLGEFANLLPLASAFFISLCKPVQPRPGALDLDRPLHGVYFRRAFPLERFLE